MGTQAELIQRLEDLRAAIATGASEVRYSDGRSTTFRSLDEMRGVASDLEAQIAATAGARPVRLVYFHGNKGT